LKPEDTNRGLFKDVVDGKLVLLAALGAESQNGSFAILEIVFHL
jgi:hypothetical protein